MEIPTLQPGDILLYDVASWKTPWSSFVDWIIRVKTWSSVAHIEIFDGGQWSLAARADGVDRYPFRSQGLRYVLRPWNWDHVAAESYFDRIARHQRYDWLGLLCFTLAVKRGSPNQMFCSEFARNLARAAAWLAFADWWSGDKTAPGSFLMVGGSAMIYDSDAKSPLAIAADMALAS